MTACYIWADIHVVVNFHKGKPTGLYYHWVTAEDENARPTLLPSPDSRGPLLKR